MTSLDDSIICSQNLMLLDNVTNYNNIAIDYYHTKLSLQERKLSYSLLLKMKKHKLLRLPSCSMEDELDYKIYLNRLHHCIWRSWSIDFYRLQNSKMNPTSINWDKENDMIVLYGPSFTSFINENEICDENKKNDIEQQKLKQQNFLKQLNIDFPIPVSNEKPNDDFNNLFGSDSELMSNSDSDTLFSSSVESTASSSSSIFDSSPILKHRSKDLSSDKKLRFSNVVKRRDITIINDEDKKIDERFITINDKFSRRSKRHIVQSTYYNTINNRDDVIINEKLINDNTIDNDIIDDNESGIGYDIHIASGNNISNETFYDCVGSSTDDDFIFFS